MARAVPYSEFAVLRLPSQRPGRGRNCANALHRRHPQRPAPSDAAGVSCGVRGWPEPCAYPSISPPGPLPNPWPHAAPPAHRHGFARRGYPWSLARPPSNPPARGQGAGPGAHSRRGHQPVLTTSSKGYRSLVAQPQNAPPLIDQARALNALIDRSSSSPGRWPWRRSSEPVPGAVSR